MGTRVNPIMSSGKKRYTTPRLVDHGDVAELTRRGGSTSADVPIGTPVPDGSVDRPDGS
jgi:hypothetical protein